MNKYSAAINNPKPFTPRSYGWLVRLQTIAANNIFYCKTFTGVGQTIK